MGAFNFESELMAADFVQYLYVQGLHITLLNGSLRNPLLVIDVLSEKMFQMIVFKKISKSKESIL